jgi:hypothetical protein
MATKKPVWVLPDGSTVGQKDLGKVKPTPKATVKPKVTATAKPKPKATPTPTKTLPSLAEYKSSAASKSMSYKQYLDFFKKKYGIK